MAGKTGFLFFFSFLQLYRPAPSSPGRLSPAVAGLTGRLRLTEEPGGTHETMGSTGPQAKRSMPLLAVGLLAKLVFSLSREDSCGPPDSTSRTTLNSSSSSSCFSSSSSSPFLFLSHASDVDSADPTGRVFLDPLLLLFLLLLFFLLPRHCPSESIVCHPYSCLCSLFLSLFPLSNSLLLSHSPIVSLSLLLLFLSLPFSSALLSLTFSLLLFLSL